MSRDQVSQLTRLCKKIKPETKAEKAARLQALAGKKGESKAVPVIKFGLNHVTDLIEQKKANLVIIAHDVDPIEMVCWLPALCRKMDVPYCIIKGKGRLGMLVHKKAASCVALTTVRQEDKAELDKLADSFKAQFNDNAEVRRRWGGGIMGIKSQHVMQRREKAIQIEQAKKLGLQIS